MKTSKRLVLLITMTALVVIAGWVCWTLVIFPKYIAWGDTPVQHTDMGYLKIGESSGVQTLNDDEVHEYRVIADKGRLIRIVAEPTSDVFINLDILRVDDSTIVERTDDPNRAPGEAVDLLINILEGKTYLIYVTSNYKTDYELQVKCEVLKLAPDNCS